ncbi:primosomal protein N' [Candidatus Erwinia haradaeae]|uniref:Replication restart protein PriA n=1 Tax=Candidatus Erwinia haradaeae TaxID=1922217 RepID=A0A451DAT6_9GAMM|nr:primosomal protein N' [Candidatus Erwinia haradaeae]VFP83404.1 Primosomal protein N' [Candidatus Erwinia haradaeae]
MYIVQVALPVSQDQNFKYVLPEHIRDVAIGGRVQVPFKSRKMIGIVIKISIMHDHSLLSLPMIHQILDSHSLYPPRLWRTLILAASYYHFSLGKILFHAIPPLLRRGYLLEKTCNNKKLAENITQSTQLSKEMVFSLKEKKFIACSANRCGSPHYDINHNNIILHPLKLLSCQPLHPPQVLATKSEKNLRTRLFINAKNKKKQLSQEQNSAITAIQNTDDTFITWLLNGIGGPDQIDVYLSILENILIRGQQAIILIPEINLIPYITSLVLQHFNVVIDVLHSSLDNTERLNVWRRARDGKTTIVIGTRSVIFTPLEQLGIIIIYEEHASSYIEKEDFSYNTRDLAILRAKQENIPIILGSSAPALETLYNVQLGKYHQIIFREYRIHIAKTKRMLVNLNGLHLQAGLSPILINKINRHLQNNHKVFLLLQCRGFSPILLCQECKWIPKCTRCNRNFTLYKKHKKLYCHQCNGARPIPSQCLECGSTYLIPVGLGIEKIADYLTTLFPAIPLTCLDGNTPYQNTDPESILSKVYHSGAHILLSTKMVFRADSLLDITLVSCINVDYVLFSSDFQAAERFAQLYNHIAGLVVGLQKKGEVIVQTYYPEHPLLQTLVYKGYDTFVKEELYTRKNILLPPYTNQAFFCAEAYDNDQAYQFLHKLIALLQASSCYDSSFRVTGPNPSLRSKVRGRYRWTIMIQHSSRAALYFLIKELRILVNTLLQEFHIRWTLRTDSYDS